VKQLEIKRPVMAKKGSIVGSRNFQWWCMCAIPLLFIIVFSYIPMFGIIIAFKNYRFDKGIFGSEWVGFKNFEMLVKSNDFLNVTRNTLVLNFLFIFTGVIAAVALALLFFELKSRTKTKIFQTIFITPNFLSWVVVGYMAYALLHPEYGMMNSILNFFGIESVDWYTTPKAWPLILAIASIWKVAGMDSIIFYSGLMGIDMELFEAAKIDGANRWQIIKSIVLPCLVPLISVVVILKIGNIFRADFGLFYQLTRDQGQLYSVTDVVDTYLYRMMKITGNMGVSTAIGLLQSIVGTVMVIITNYFSKKINPDSGLL